MAEVPADNFITTVEDSRRWRHIERRPGDIIISTPPKSGTTWMQGIVAALLFPAGDAPASTGQMSPWIDARATPIEDLVERLGAQDHRRFVKTHSPADCIPVDKRCRYIVVYRDGRDTLVSWANHRATMRPAIVEHLNSIAAASGVDPMNAQWDGDLDELMAEWETICSPVRHLRPWWKHRHQPFVLFVHYADLLLDLEAEMRRVAEFCEISVPEDAWEEVVDRCGIDRMRAEADSLGRLDAVFEGGAAAFYNQGVNGRWAEILSPSQVERYHTLVADGLPNEAAAWLEVGSRTFGLRPEEIGEPPDPASTRRWHPIFGRIPKASAGALHEITDRRVEQGREVGLFDNLAGAGKPIPDIDRQRPTGWWAQRFVTTERSKVKAMQLDDELRRAMPGLWRLETEVLVEARVHELNTKIDEYNRVTTVAPRERLQLAATLDQWRRLRDR